MKTKSIGRLISILHRKAQIYLNASLKEYDIGSSEYIFLVALLAEDGITQEELSEKIYIDKAATARSIKSLEEKGYVRREPDSHDKRAKKVYCTEKARACSSHIHTVLRNWTKLLTEGMDKETVDLLTGSLEKMSDKICSKEFNNFMKE